MGLLSLVFLTLRVLLPLSACFCSYPSSRFYLCFCSYCVDHGAFLLRCQCKDRVRERLGISVSQDTTFRMVGPGEDNRSFGDRVAFYSQKMREIDRKGRVGIRSDDAQSDLLYVGGTVTCRQHVFVQAYASEFSIVLLGETLRGGKSSFSA